MINGVMNIIAAVLFAVISLDKGVDIIWLSIAGIYLVTGVLNLIAYAIRNKRNQKAAKAEGAKEEKARAEKAKAETAKLENAKAEREKAENAGGDSNG